MNLYNQKTIKQALTELIRVYHLKSKLSQTKLKVEWENIMGKTIAKYTEEVFVKDKKLFIYTSNAALKNELLFSKEKIVKKVNAFIEEDYINDVVVK
jgi:predicted nucleic acid-binding Zn ribbon protein